MGKLIAIDGLDGAGKETQWELLCARLIREGHKIRPLSFPNYENPNAEPLKLYLNGFYGKDPEAVNAYGASTFFAVDRYSSYLSDWKKDYNNNEIIITNRYTTANAIHQASKLSGAERDEFLRWLWDFEFVKLGLPSPDVTIFLEIPVEISMELIRKRSSDTGRSIDIHENISHLEKAHEAALYVSEKWKWKKINCTNDKKLLSREKISDMVYAAVKEAFGGNI